MNPLISIIVPVYNVEKYLNRCLNSIINQKYKNIEIILIDDGSPDNCPRICDDYAKKDSRIKVIHKSNGGVSSARNLGLDIASGEYISFVDSDDYIEKELYQKIVDIINMDPSIDLIRYNGIEEKTENNFKISKLYTEKEGLQEKSQVLSLLAENKLIGWIWLQVFKKELIKDKVRFKEDVHMCEDMIFITEIFCEASRIYFLKDALYHYMFNQSGATKSPKNALRNVSELIDCYKYLCIVFEKFSLLNNEIQTKLATSRFVSLNYRLGFAVDVISSRELFYTLINHEVLMDVLNNVNYNSLNLSVKLLFLSIKKRSAFLFNIYFKYRKYKWKHKNI